MKIAGVENKRNTRCKNTNEVFTPCWFVNEMLDELDEVVWHPEKTFCDPTCGSGNMLIPILYRKLVVYNHDPTQALRTIRGIDIMRDNIRETRMRLLRLTSIFYELTTDDVDAVLRNIVWVSLKIHPKGTLNYNFSFNSDPKPGDVDKWISNIHNNILDNEHLPVNAEPGAFDTTYGDIFQEDAEDDEGYDI